LVASDIFFQCRDKRVIKLAIDYYYSDAADLAGYPQNGLCKTTTSLTTTGSCQESKRSMRRDYRHQYQIKISLYRYMITASPI